MIALKAHRHTHTRPPQSAASAGPAARAEQRGSPAEFPYVPDHAVECGEAPLDDHAREELIRTAAYLRAEYRGFAAGHELDDWLGAERDIDNWIATRAAPQRYG